MLQCPDLADDETCLLAHAGAPCPESLKRAVMVRARPGALREFYGSTKAQFTVCSPEEWVERPGTVGRARAGRRLFVDGTSWCDMPGFAGFSYWRDPAATRRARRGDACTIGDLVRLDPDGYLSLTGRRHDLIISGGVDVYPAEVDGVREIAVFGLPDEQRGQRVCPASVVEGSQAVEEAQRAAASARTSGPRPPRTRPASSCAVPSRAPGARHGG